jgi:hypothetical protein
MEEPTIRPGDEVTDECRRIEQGVPFGQMKLDDDQKLQINFDASLREEPAGATDPSDDPLIHTTKQHVLLEHAKDGITFCEPIGEPDKIFMQKHSPIIGRVALADIEGFRVTWKMIVYNVEHNSFINGITVTCYTTSTTGSFGFTTAELEAAAIKKSAGDGNTTKEMGSGAVPTAGFNWSATNPSYTHKASTSVSVGLQLNNLYELIQLYVTPSWTFTSSNGFTTKVNTRTVQNMDSWLKQANLSTSCWSGHAGTGFHPTYLNVECEIESQSWLATDSIWHCRIPGGANCSEFDVQCGNTGITGGNKQFAAWYAEVVPTGFTLNGEELAWNDPLLGIPADIWWPLA